MNFIIMIHSEHKSTDGGTTCEFEMARRISNHGYETKVYYPYGTVVSGIYDKFATLEDVNDDTVAIYCAHRYGNPLNAKRVVRWVAYGLDKCYYDSFGDQDIIYYHLPFCKNNLSTQSLFACFLSPDVKNRNELRTLHSCYIVKKGIVYSKNKNRVNTNTFPHSELFQRKNKIPYTKVADTLCLDGYPITASGYIDMFNKTKYFFCYDPCSFLVIIALLCGCIVIQDPVDGYTEEEWTYATTGLRIKLNGFSYGIENIKYAKETISNAYGPCMQFVNRSDESIKKFLYEMENKTYNLDKCYPYEESPVSLMFQHRS